MSTRDVVISGIGQSDVGRRLGRSPLTLTVDAALEAIADAGLSVSDIDGVATWPGNTEATPGFSGVGVWDIKDALGLSLNWFCGGIEGPAQIGSIIQAYAAVKAGLADHVLCFRTLWESTAQTAGRRASVPGAGSDRITGDAMHMQYLLPFGAVSATNWAGLIARRHFHTYGTTREQLGALSVNTRANAALNPKAVLRDPLTVSDYMAARMISDPLCLFDCDIPIDGSTAVIVSRADAAPDLRTAPLRIAATSSAMRDRPQWDQHGDLTSMTASEVGADLWRKTDLTPADVDVAAIYDGFTILTLLWLEALGLCGRGESGPFVADAANIALDGKLPLNTGGGQLSAGRLHGYGHLYEACVQLRGAGGERQVPGTPEVAVVATGGGPLAGALLLTRDR
ncbi:MULTISPECIES: thiolase family protein [Nocardia]|uniref:thiolase family protein n=1 Tax=Nocardia TaxID=1817 RepID=UPI000D69B578|nr:MULTISPECIES: thiolase family protein [Nocardia]